MYHIQDNITLDNYNQVLSNVSGAVRGAATNEQEQTTNNLTVVAAAFERSAAQLANQRTSIPNTVSSLLFCLRRHHIASFFCERKKVNSFFGSVKIWPTPRIGTK